jgi:hypothetical protein
MNNPIQAPADIDFVQQKIAEFDIVFKAGIKERDDDAKKNDAWNGQEPFLRLYHVMMEDKVFMAYADIHRAKDHAELDGRNSSERPPDFFELAAEVSNGPGFNPVTNKYPS